MRSQKKRSKLACAATLAAAAHGLMTPPSLRAEPTTPPGPIVTLSADAPAARLQHRLPNMWQDVCPSPCLQVLDPGADYRVGGVAIQASDPFKLTRTDGTVLVRAKVVTSGRNAVGTGLGVVGGVVGLLGAYGLYSSFNYVDTQEADGTLPGRAALRTLGVGALVVAAVLLVVGIPLATSRTTVEVR